MVEVSITPAVLQVIADFQEAQHQLRNQCQVARIVAVSVAADIQAAVVVDTDNN